MKRFTALLSAAFATVTLSAATPHEGYRAFAEWINDFKIDVNWGGPSDSYYYTGASTSHGYQFNRWLFVGGGVAIERWPKYNKNYSIPVFADARVDLKFGRFTPFVDVKLGYNFCHRIIDGFWPEQDKGSGGLYFSPSVGYRVGLPYNLGLNFGIGLTVNGYRYRMYDYVDEHYYSASHFTKTTLCLRLALDFRCH